MAVPEPRQHFETRLAESPRSALGALRIGENVRRLKRGNQAPAALREGGYGTHYQDFALYSISGDPAEMVNLMGRPEYKEIADNLRTELEKRIVAAGEPATKITPVDYYA
jgi:hypothetical protein